MPPHSACPQQSSHYPRLQYLYNTPYLPMAPVLYCLALKAKSLEFLEPPGIIYPETQCNSSEDLNPNLILQIFRSLVWEIFLKCLIILQF